MMEKKFLSLLLKILAEREVMTDSGKEFQTETISTKKENLWAVVLAKV